MTIERRMSALDARADASAAFANARIEALALQAFTSLWQLLQDSPDLAPREAVSIVMGGFGSDYSTALAQAFERLLQQSVTPVAVRVMPVGDVKLSDLLYRHSLETGAEVTRIVRTHAQGVQDARALLLDLYDGYSPDEGVRRPLEGRARATLPRALREVTRGPRARRELATIYARAQAQAARVKSPALRAAYTEALDAWERGAGRQELRNRLDVAFREKTRFFADRIAQSELARAYQAKASAELMADPESFAVQVKLNPAHPKADICDLHGRADLFGLGKGIYPKGKAPRPPFHPFCWCRLRPRQDIDPAGGIERPGAAADYLRDLGAAKAGAVMGSQERAWRVLAGETVESVVNEGKHDAHKLRRVEDPQAQAHPIIRGGL